MIFTIAHIVFLSDIKTDNISCSICCTPQKCSRQGIRDWNESCIGTWNELRVSLVLG